MDNKVPLHEMPEGYLDSRGNSSEERAEQQHGYVSPVSLVHHLQEKKHFRWSLSAISYHEVPWRHLQHEFALTKQLRQHPSQAPFLNFCKNLRCVWILDFELLSALSYKFCEVWLNQNYFVEYEISFRKKTSGNGQPDFSARLLGSRKNRM